MNRLILKITALALFNMALGLAFLSLSGRWHDLKPWETDSLLAVMPADTRHEAVVLGSSHAYVFSRLESNHPLLEDAVGGPVFNMALPTGGAVWPARLFLEQYLASGNRAATLLYFLEPFVLYSDASNTAHKFVYVEPFRFSFFFRLLQSGYPPRRIFTYLRSKFSFDSVFSKPQYMEAFHGGLEPHEVNEAVIQGRMASLYLEGMNEETFARYSAELERILKLAENHQMAVRLITPPTLIGHEPGQARMENLLSELASRYPFEYRDFTDAMADPSLYYNLDHMNTRGVKTFCGTLLKPFLNSQ